MFNSTHTLVGFALARSGLRGWTANATTTAVIASNLPDIDIVTQFFGTATYLDYHRGFTHSIFGIPLLAFGLAALMSMAGRGSLWRHFGVALVVMFTHPILDWTNTYGVRPFLPFSSQWFYGDLLFVIDPYLDLILLITVLISYYAERRHQSIARLGLILSLTYAFALLEARSIAKRHFDRYLADTLVINSTVGPDFLNPFAWTGFVDTPTEVASASINVRTGQVRSVSRMLKAEDSPITRAAAATYTASVFRGFARFPVTRVSRTSSGYRVLLIDMRFFTLSAMTALSAEILLDDNLRVTAESISFVRPID